MERILKINDEPILNFLDLKRQFNPIYFYQHLEMFCAFAEVHCLPLRTLLTNKKTGTKYMSKYLTKEFWLMVIQSSGRFTDITPEEQFDKITEVILRTKSDQDDDVEEIMEAKNVLAREIEDAEINDKLSVLCRLFSEQEAYYKVVPLLAICELAEIAPSQVDVSLWNDKTRSVVIPKISEENLQLTKMVQKSETLGSMRHDSEIEFFNYDHDVYLTAGAYVYKFWYHEENRLGKDKRIKTVLIAAKGGTNHYASVKIELYSPKTKKMVQTVILKKDEYRYCNVSGGKIIKFLPIVSISDDLCVMRKALGSSNLFIQPKNAESWQLNIDGVSSFVACGNKLGFILVQDGKINTQFFRPAEDYFHKLRLEMVPLPVVEVMVQGEQYFFLLEDGTVLSNAKDITSKEEVSLTNINRYPFIFVSGKGSCEAVLSESQKSLAVIGTDFSKNTVIFDGDGKHFEAEEQEGCIIVRFQQGGDESYENAKGTQSRFFL